MLKQIGSRLDFARLQVGDHFPAHAYLLGERRARKARFKAHGMDAAADPASTLARPIGKVSPRFRIGKGTDAVSGDFDELAGRPARQSDFR